MFARHLCSAAFLVAFICIRNSKFDPLPACADPLPACADPLPACADPLPACTDPLPACADPLPACADPLPACADPLPACADPLPACADRNCTCDPNDTSVVDDYDKYMVVIDAGSSHTTVNLYGMSPPDLPKYMEEQVDNSTGIDKFGNNAQGLKDYLQPLINNVSLKVPLCKLCQTPIFLGATAGMRYLNHTNPSASYKLMEEVKKILNNSGFCYNSGNAKILKGSEEAGLSWVVANSVCESGHNKSKGALNLGGGSAEIAYECRDKCEGFDLSNADVLSYDLCGKNHSVFSKANECYGLYDAMRRFLVMNIWENYILNGKVIKYPIENPCNPRKNHTLPTKKSDIFKGYCTGTDMLVDTNFKHYINALKNDTEFDFVGNWNKEKCDILIQNLLSDRCKNIYIASCFDKPLPGLWDNSEGFVAMDAYAKWLRKLFKSTGMQNITTKRIEKEFERICEESTDKADADCFAVKFIVTMLTHGYGFNVESLNKFELMDKEDWTYGYAVINNNDLNNTH